MKSNHPTKSLTLFRTEISAELPDWEGFNKRPKLDENTRPRGVPPKKLMRYSYRSHSFRIRDAFWAILKSKEQFYPNSYSQQEENLPKVLDPHPHPHPPSSSSLLPTTPKKNTVFDLASNSATVRRVEVLMHWCVEVLMCWCVDVLMCWCVDALMCWGVDVLMCWCVDVLMCWCVDALMCWGVDVLMCW